MPPEPERDSVALSRRAAFLKKVHFCSLLLLTRFTNAHYCWLTFVNHSKHQLQTKQAERFRQTAKLALIRRRKSIRALAAELGRPRESVSRAINRGEFPRLRQKIAEALAI